MHQFCVDYFMFDTPTDTNNTYSKVDCGTSCRMNRTKKKDICVDIRFNLWGRIYNWMQCKYNRIGSDWLVQIRSSPSHMLAFTTKVSHSRFWVELSWVELYCMYVSQESRDTVLSFLDWWLIDILRLIRLSIILSLILPCSNSFYGSWRFAIM